MLSFFLDDIGTWLRFHYILVVFSFVFTLTKLHYDLYRHAAVQKINSLYIEPEIKQLSLNITKPFLLIHSRFMYKQKCYICVMSVTNYITMLYDPTDKLDFIKLDCNYIKQPNI